MEKKKSEVGSIHFGWTLVEKDYKNLEKCTLYFVASEQLIEENDDLDSILKDAWKFCEIEVIGLEELKDYIGNENCAFITIGMIIGSSDDAEIYYELWRLDNPAKGMDAPGNTVKYARFNINFECSFSNFFARNGGGSDALFAHLYSKPNVGNLKAGIIANYLRLIEQYLKNRTSYIGNNYNIIKDIVILDELKNLEKQTLYITENILIESPAPISGGCKKSGQIKNINDVMSKYPYKYKIISFEKLNEMILEGEDFYYAACIKKNYIGACLTVYNSETGACIFNDAYLGLDYNDEDFGKLAKKISKAIGQ
jgi:hypothetical protein